MKPFLSHSITAGILALGLAAGLGAPAFSASVVPAAPSVPASAAAPEIIPARASWAGNEGNRGDYWRYRGHRQWHGNRWHRSYRDNRRWRYNHRRYYRGSGIYFGLGVGPGYDYYAPRRTYRVYRGGSAHVRWCYNRYRSYRAWDNTFQPYHGPRRQCRSPYRR